MVQIHRTGLFPVEHHLALARLANALAFRCAPSPSAYSVGAVVADAGGLVLGGGYSRQTAPHHHAEEAALQYAKASGHNLIGAYIYTSLEPCGSRKSKSCSCVQQLIEAGISRVYYTAREPRLFQRPMGLQSLRLAGVKCVELPNFAGYFQKANQHLLRDASRTFDGLSKRVDQSFGGEDCDHG